MNDCSPIDDENSNSGKSDPARITGGGGFVAAEDGRIVGGKADPYKDDGEGGYVVAGARHRRREKRFCRMMALRLCVRTQGLARGFSE
jgi:hypothetical protein